MSKKKKKKTKLTEHQQHKIEEAQRKKAYIGRVINMMRYLKYDAALPFIDARQQDELWRCRTGLGRVDFSQVTHFDKEDRAYIQRELFALFNRREMDLPDGTGEERKIMVSDFYEIWLPLMLALSSKSMKESPRSTKIKLRETLEQYGISFEEDTEDTPSYLSKVFSDMEVVYRGFLLTFAFQFSNPCMHFFWVQKMDYSARSGRLNREIFFASGNPVHTLGAGVRGSRRFLHRVGYPVLDMQYGEICWLKAKIPRNPYIHFDADAEYEVYIQEHAIKRMFERLDGVFESTVNIHMNFCFWTWQADWYKGSLIIPFDLHHQKVGYFLADFTEDKKIVIRTFYFITYDRTPEGEALASYAGLQALDKKYLGIDRLSTFLASNFDKDSKFAEICRETGLGHLLDLQSLRNALDLDVSQAKSISNEFIAKYLSALEGKGEF